VAAAEKIVASCKLIVESLREIHQDSDPVKHLGQFYQALYDHGARLVDQRGHGARHQLYLPAQTNRTEFSNAKNLAALIFDSLELGEASPNHGKDFLKQLAEVYSGSKDTASGAKEIERLDREQGEARRIAIEQAHHDRLAQMKKPKTPQVIAAERIRLNPSQPPAPLRERSWHHSPDNYPTRSLPDGSSIIDSDGNLSGIQ
jgi:hypothetical protein